MELTAKELKKMLEKVPDDSIIRFQRIEDFYIDGRNKNSVWIDGNKKANENLEALNNVKGWTTYDMPCDTATEDCNGNNKDFWKCPYCSQRNQYIIATRCFIHNNELFIDGHY